jgi:hypothetical protein
MIAGSWGSATLVSQCADLLVLLTEFFCGHAMPAGPPRGSVPTALCRRYRGRHGQGWGDAPHARVFQRPHRLCGAPAGGRCVDGTTPRTDRALQLELASASSRQGGGITGVPPPSFCCLCPGALDVPSLHLFPGVSGTRWLYSAVSCVIRVAGCPSSWLCHPRAMRTLSPAAQALISTWSRPSMARPPCSSPHPACIALWSCVCFLRGPT